MEHSPSWEANSSSVNKQIPYILWNPKVHYHVHSWPPVLILSQINSIHKLLNKFCKINFNIIHPSTPSHPSGLFPYGFYTKTPYTPLLSPTRAACPFRPILIYLITQILFDEAYRSWSSSLWSLLHSPVTSSLLGPNILLKTLFSNTLSLRSPLNVTDQDSQNNRQNYSSVYFNIYIFGQRDGKQNILQQMTPIIPWLPSALISSRMQFWFF